jgi:hypothetical protein
MNLISYCRTLIDLSSSTIKHLLPKGNGKAVARFANPNPMSRRIVAALKLAPRGAVPNDILAIDRFSIRLDVKWFARDVHPWDRDLPPRLQAELFTNQCLEDVEAVIPRLFEQLPEIDVLEIGVLQRDSSIRIVGGIVHRTDLVTQSGSSVGMRLRTLGINYRRAGLEFETIA